MANEEKRESGSQNQQLQEQQETRISPTSWTGRVENKYLELKQHAEEYPYVWASYILVYGGFTCWAGYRWRKLRATETRVRVLQERLRKLVEAEEATAATTSTSAPTPSVTPHIDKSTSASKSSQ
ncbi:hypothetical protein MKW94_026646 [Papaver nudicaule]|uniref:Transmembrane protein n=1 Tax=Papaver nudicaule TaxID=74823 RepID=A0AA41UXT7_PAPNU|nr:hypothetical protein [Papaver nudicaule]MCL7039596.1 hypothetical protein [Papaver nudicaule]MCL7050670.1 hypothetical protein [Papaver nudicaule]